MTREEFLERVLRACDIAEQKQARFNRAVACAQAAHESNWGNSSLASRHNNIFGIKAGKGWAGSTVDLPTWEYDAKAKKNVQVIATWRAYPSWNECIVDYARVIATQPWFRDALPHINDPENFLRALMPAPGQYGWATDPKYFAKVRAVGYTIQSLGGPKWEAT